MLTIEGFIGDVRKAINIGSAVNERARLVSIMDVYKEQVRAAGSRCLLSMLQSEENSFDIKMPSFVVKNHMGERTVLNRYWRTAHILRAKVDEDKYRYRVGSGLGSLKNYKRCLEDGNRATKRIWSGVYAMQRLCAISPTALVDFCSQGGRDFFRHLYFFLNLREHAQVKEFKKALEHGIEIGDVANSRDAECILWCCGAILLESERYIDHDFLVLFNALGDVAVGSELVVPPEDDLFPTAENDGEDEVFEPAQVVEPQAQRIPAPNADEGAATRLSRVHIESTRPPRRGQGVSGC
jgi:hypothetical protein